MRKAWTDEDVLTLARQRVADVFDRFDLPAVSFSGGKDSTVVLNVALEEMQARRADGRLPPDYKLHVLFWDEEAIHPETIEYCARVAAHPDIDFHWYCLPIKHVNACSRRHPFWWCWAPEKEEKWCRPMPDGALTEAQLGPFPRAPHADSLGFVFPKDGRTVGLMLGIRADESLRRYQSVSHREKDNWLSTVSYARHITQCKVIYDWTTIDVWTAPKILGWDWNRAYDVMARAGLSPNQQRVAPPFGQQPLQNLWMWKLCWPELWQRLCLRVPGASSASRYAKGPLYGSSGAVAKRPDESYEDAIVRVLHKWEPGLQRDIANRLRREMARHGRLHPGVPIPDEEPFVMDLVTGVTSGITWDWLLKVAVRGDVKGRMNPWRPSTEDVEARRLDEWGPNWKTKHPEAARRTKWDSAQQMYVDPNPRAR